MRPASPGAAHITSGPEPLAGELRTPVALGGKGGLYAFVPAALVFRRSGGQPGGGHVGTAELSVVLVDVRLGRGGFRTVARGGGDYPWSALTPAVKSLKAGLP